MIAMSLEEKVMAGIKSAMLAKDQRALEALPFVDSAEASHTAGTAVVTLSGPADKQALRAAVEAEDYSVSSME